MIEVATAYNNNSRDKYNEKSRIIKKVVLAVPCIISTKGAIPKSHLQDIKLMRLPEYFYKPMRKAVFLATFRDTPAIHVNHGPGNLKELSQRSVHLITIILGMSEPSPRRDHKPYY